MVMASNTKEEINEIQQNADYPNELGPGVVRITDFFG